MNAERLLAHFERISEAPDAIARLRRFILDLAVHGKLVEQDPEDEPVEDLLQRIAVEKTSRRSTRARSTHLERVEGWCSIPASWNFVRLDTVCTVIMGSSPPGSTYNTTGEGVPLINGPVEFTPGPFGRTTIKQYTTAPSAFCDEGDFLVCVRGSTTGRTNIAAFKACIGRGVAAIQPLFEDKFIRLAIRVRQEEILQMGRGIAFPSISLEQLSGLPVPLPPLAEQHRIVAKVDELMSLCDQLEAARQQREQGRERLLAATLQRLNQPAEDHASFRQDASFALQVLPSLTTTPAQIKQLRQTILHLAVRGKLVEQHPEDEPAEELLGRISYEKARLARVGEIRKPKQLPEIDVAPFMVPNNWTWCRIREATSDRAQKVPNERFTYIDVGAINNEAGIISEPTILDPSDAPSRARKIVKKGDVIYSCVRPYLLNVAIVDFDFDPEPITSTAFAVLYGHELVLSRYLWIVLRSPFLVKCVEECQRGQAYPAINDADFSLLPIPPPLAEQHRIVAKVDELMALCDQLEQQLNQADQQRRRLLEALLAEALGGRLPTAQEESHAVIA